MGEPLVGPVLDQVGRLCCRVRVPREAEDPVCLREVAKHRREGDDVADEEPGVLTEASKFAADGCITHDLLARVVHATARHR